MNGIVIVDKPAGWTSQDVAAKLRRVYNTRRVGHGGTLDPMATGVLPVFLGRATRAVPFFEGAEKKYAATLRLGLTTDTEDVTGRVLSQRPVSVTEAQFRALLPRFTGTIRQVPPMYSALKVQGRRLYDLAREGREVARPPREITIFSLECTAFAGEEAEILVHCSKGTYIRALCKDIGEALGCGACMASLRRVAAGGFGIDRAAPLAEIVESGEPERYVLPTDSLFSDLPAVTLTETQAQRCRCGAPFSRPLPDGRYRVYGPGGEFLMVGRVEKGTVFTEKSFFEV